MKDIIEKVNAELAAKMKTVKVTFRLTAFNGEIIGSNWLQKLQAKASNNMSFAERQFEIDIDDYDSFVSDFCLNTIKKGQCVYIEVKVGSITRNVFASNSDKDYWLHTIPYEYPA